MARERWRFNAMDDVLLLREVLDRNPYEDAYKWKDILGNVVVATRKNFSMRCIRNHLDHLLRLWSSGDLANLRKSGTQAQYAEKELLLDQISNMQREYKGIAKMTFNEHEYVKRAPVEEQSGPEDDNVEWFEEVQIEDVVEEADNLPNSGMSNADSDDAVEIISEQGNDVEMPEPTCNMTSAKPSGPARIRRIHMSELRKQAFSKWQKKTDKEFRLKEKQLRLEERRVVLEERKLKIEEKKFAMEIKERESKLEAEKEERKQKMVIAEHQQKLINLLFNKLAKQQ